MTTEPPETRVSETPVGAASHEAEQWHSMNWPQAHRMVRRLQARIVVRP